MAEGTRMKQLESRLDALELGMNQTHEAITHEREEQAAAREAMQREMERNCETMDQFGQQIQSIVTTLGFG